MPAQLVRLARRGFSMLELMAVLLVIAILTTIAIPSVSNSIVMGQVSDALTLSTFVKTAVQNYYAQTQKLPASNATVSIPPANDIVSNWVSNLAVANGVITITFGNQANPRLRGRLLTLRPAVVTGYPQTPITWLCAHAAVPTNMTAIGTDQTNIPSAELPYLCR
jgi:type IV pilus assembly protein PilA